MPSTFNLATAWADGPTRCFCKTCMDICEAYLSMKSKCSVTGGTVLGERMAVSAGMLRQMLQDIHRVHQPKYYPSANYPMDVGRGRQVQHFTAAADASPDWKTVAVAELAEAYPEKYGGRELMESAGRFALQSLDQIEEAFFRVVNFTEDAPPSPVVPDTDRTQAEADDDNVPRGRSTGKFIVCEHCRSHGLPCNEAAVCDQCMLHEVACVHRWCQLSPEKQSECEMPTCRYVHRDSMPDSAQSLKWLILPGNLMGYLESERKGRMSRAPEDLNLTVGGVNAKQTEAKKVMEDYVNEGNATLETVRMNCGCMEKELEKARRQEEAIQKMLHSRQQYFYR